MRTTRHEYSEIPATGCRQHDCSLPCVGIEHDATERGFSLVEVLVASTILIVGLVALAQLFIVATASNISSRHVTYATVLAAQKLEELRSLPSAQQSDLGSVDEIGEYWRRWSIDPLPAEPGNAVVIQVLVGHRSGGSRGEARLVTVIRQPQ